MKPTVTVSFTSDIQPIAEAEARSGMKFVCRMCCALALLRWTTDGGMETWCPAGHPQVMVSNEGKVIGTSA